MKMPELSARVTDSSASLNSSARSIPLDTSSIIIEYYYNSTIDKLMTFLYTNTCVGERLPFYQSTDSLLIELFGYKYLKLVLIGGFSSIFPNK